MKTEIKIVKGDKLYSVSTGHVYKLRVVARNKVVAKMLHRRGVTFEDTLPGIKEKIESGKFILNLNPTDEKPKRVRRPKQKRNRIERKLYRINRRLLKYESEY